MAKLTEMRTLLPEPYILAVDNDRAFDAIGAKTLAVRILGEGGMVAGPVHDKVYGYGKDCLMFWADEFEIAQIRQCLGKTGMRFTIEPAEFGKEEER